MADFEEIYLEGENVLSKIDNSIFQIDPSFEYVMHLANIFF